MQALRGGLSGAHIGANGDQHASITCRTRKHRTNHEADCGLRTDQEVNNGQNDHTDDGDGRILPPQIGLSAFLNSGGDFFHLVVASRSLHQGRGLNDAIEHRQKAGRNNPPNIRIHAVEAPSCVCTYDLRTLQNVRKPGP